MFVIRRTTNICHKKRLATTFFFAQTLPKETAKQLFGKLPVVSVDTILHLRCFYLSLYQPCFFQFLQMLGNGSFRNWKLLVYIAKIASILLGKKL